MSISLPTASQPEIAPIPCQICTTFLARLLNKANEFIFFFSSALHRVAVTDLTIHRLCNGQPSGLPHWSELLETMGVASYGSPESVVWRLSFLLDKGEYPCSSTVIQYADDVKPCTWLECNLILIAELSHGGTVVVPLVGVEILSGFITFRLELELCPIALDNHLFEGAVAGCWVLHFFVIHLICKQVSLRVTFRGKDGSVLLLISAAFENYVLRGLHGKYYVPMVFKRS